MGDGAAKGRRARTSSGGVELARLALAAAFAHAAGFALAGFAVAAPEPATPEPATPEPATPEPAAPATDAPGPAPASPAPATARSLPAPAMSATAPATSALVPLALVPARAQDLCVTEGEVRALGANGLTVDSTKMRAFLNRATGQSIEARFKYLGGTARESPLGSGQVRRQFGLKLEAQDACNLLYAMWRIEPEAKLVVSVKANPGEHSSAECGNRGYRNLKPARSAAVPSLRPGDTHALRAELRGTSMRVLIDGHPVWEGDVGAEALRLAGPVGLRSDNVRLEIELRTAAPLAGAPGESKACRTGGAESE